MIDRRDVTGLVLAGGRGSRMGGVDKGLLDYHGMPLARHALLRLQRQVGQVMVSANRNLDVYRSFGATVWPDIVADRPGPLAGFQLGLQHCRTPWLATVPCDSPLFPDDLVARLASAAVAGDAEIAIAATLGPGVLPQLQPVFCLMKSSLLASLLRFTQGGQRQVSRWAAMHRCVEVPFDDPHAFANVNTPAEFEQLRAQHAMRAGQAS